MAHFTLEQTQTPKDACRQVKCEKCGKVTWAGCGKHVDQVMGSVPDADKCTCTRE